MITRHSEIVCHYPEWGLHLLSVRALADGVELLGENNPYPYFSKVDRMRWTSYEALKKLNTQNEEGVVLFFPTANIRIKVKFEWYQQIHKLLQHMSPKAVWEILSSGAEDVELPVFTPQHLKDLVSDTKRNILEALHYLTKHAEAAHERVKDLPTRKEQALALQLEPRHIQSAVFALLDGHDWWKGPLWRAVKPDRKFKSILQEEA